MISDSDSNIDNQIDNQIDNSIEIKNPNSISRRSIPSIPPIDVLSSEFIEITNYPLLDGIYMRGYASHLNYFYSRMDGLYDILFYNNFWVISNSETFINEFQSDDSQDSLVLPGTNWYEISDPNNKIPLIIIIPL